MPVGTNIGVVPQDYGFDLSKVVNTYVAVGQLRALTAKTKATEEASRVGEWKKLLEKDYDYFIEHQAYIQSGVSKLADSAARLIAAGKDPYRDINDPEVRKWHEQRSALESAAAVSKDIEEAYKEYVNLIKSENWMKVENKDEILDYFTRPIEEHLKDPSVPPPPRFTGVGGDILKRKMEIVRGWRSAHDVEPRQTDVQQIVTDVLQSGDTDTKLWVTMMRQQYDQLDESVKKRLESEGAQSGVDGWRKFMEKSVWDAFYPGMAQEEIDAVKRRLEVKYSGNVNYVPKEAINREVNALLAGRDAMVVNDVNAGLYGDPDDPIEKNREAAKKYYSNVLRDAFATGLKDSGDGGGGKDNFEKYKGDKWWADLTSNDPSRIKAALDYLGQPGLTELVRHELLKGQQVIGYDVTDGAIKLRIGYPGASGLLGLSEGPFADKEKVITFDQISGDGAVGRERAKNVFAKIAKREYEGVINAPKRGILDDLLNNK